MSSPRSGKELDSGPAANLRKTPGRLASQSEKKVKSSGKKQRKQNPRKSGKVRDNIECSVKQTKITDYGTTQSDTGSAFFDLSVQKRIKKLEEGYLMDPDTELWCDQVKRNLTAIFNEEQEKAEQSKHFGNKRTASVGDISGLFFKSNLLLNLSLKDSQARSRCSQGNGGHKRMYPSSHEGCECNELDKRGSKGEHIIELVNNERNQVIGEPDKSEVNKVCTIERVNRINNGMEQCVSDRFETEATIVLNPCDLGKEQTNIKTCDVDVASDKAGSDIAHPLNPIEVASAIQTRHGMQ